MTTLVCRSLAFQRRRRNVIEFRRVVPRTYLASEVFPDIFHYSKPYIT